VGVLLALASAVCYGLADFTGGLLSRRAGFVAVALAGQAGGLVLTLLVVPIAPATALPALQYVALAQAASSAGIWPVAAGRAAATLAILPLLFTAGDAGCRPTARQVLFAAGTGALAATALTLYLAATREELLVVAVVLSSFYPAIPVLLGVTALRERLSWTQTAGLIGAAAAIGLLTLA
jgi:drug/metabolite transporter (DMT)-like permease